MKELNNNQKNQTLRKIKDIEVKFINNVCSQLPNAFWDRKKHIVSLSYEKDFDERNVPTRAKDIHMSTELENYCKEEIKGLKEKKLIRDSKSPWLCSAFYVNKNAEIERGTLRLIINYKP